MDSDSAPQVEDMTKEERNVGDYFTLSVHQTRYQQGHRLFYGYPPLPEEGAANIRIIYRRSTCCYYYGCPCSRERAFYVTMRSETLPFCDEAKRAPCRCLDDCVCAPKGQTIFLFRSHDGSDEESYPCIPGIILFPLLTPIACCLLGVRECIICRESYLDRKDQSFDKLPMSRILWSLNHENKQSLLGLIIDNSRARIGRNAGLDIASFLQTSSTLKSFEITTPDNLSADASEAISKALYDTIAPLQHVIGIQEFSLEEKQKRDKV